MLTITDIAKLIGVYSTTSVYRMYREGFIPSPVQRDGKLMLWNRTEIMTFCRKRNIAHAFAV